MGEIHELFVLALSLVWFAGATPEGILHLRNPKLGPNSTKRILDARSLDPNSWVHFLILSFPANETPQKIHPAEIHLPKFTFQNSTQKSGQKNSHCTSAEPFG